jgi:transcriptional regulatory protein RtcR
MATLADGGRITEQLVDDEIARLREHWVEPVNDTLRGLMADSELRQLDAFDRLQLEAVVGVCRRSRSLAAAGRTLFGASRTRRGTINDSDPLRKYLARCDAAMRRHPRWICDVADQEGPWSEQVGQQPKTK